MKKGQIFRNGRSWFVRYRQPVVENGRVPHEQRCKRLAPVVATASFTGLGKSGLRDLQWADFSNAQQSVKWKVWNTQLGETKTPTREAAAPLMPALSLALESYRARSGEDRFSFAGERKRTLLNLVNLEARVIRSALEKTNLERHGWHAFRRGLGTNLNLLRVPDKAIQGILSHADIGTVMNV